MPFENLLGIMQAEPEYLLGVSGIMNIELNVSFTCHCEELQRRSNLHKLKKYFALLTMTYYSNPLKQLNILIFNINSLYDSRNMTC